MDLTALTLAISLGYSQYTDEKGSTPEPHFRVAVGHEESPLYAWGQYEDLKVRMLGQPLGKSSITSVGIGARKFFGDFFGFAEVGYGVIDEGAQDIIQQEIIYTELLMRHRVDGRPAPVILTNNYDQDSYDTVWELDNGLLGEVGVGYAPNEHWRFTLSYRPFYVKEHIELEDPDWREATGGGYWQETRSRDLSSISLRIGWEF